MPATDPPPQSREPAILGGQPAFAEPLHVGRPNIGNRALFQSLLDDALDRRWLSNDGPLVQRLEGEIAERLGVRHVVAVVNGTVGLEIAARALGLTGEVIVPSYTFVATAHALSWLGLTPVFCDVDPETHTLDPAHVEAAITERTSAIVPVHLWGRAADVDALQLIADRHGLRLLYDAAHAFDCSRDSRTVGGFGDCEVFSFHATKFFNTFEGGAITTNDDELAGRLRLMRNFGFTGLDQVDGLGTNGKMTEVCAAMGIANLSVLDDVVAANQRNFAVYDEALRDVPGISLLKPDAFGRSNFQYVVAIVDPDIYPLSRDQLVDVLWAENVRARRYFYPGVHRMQPYAGDGRVWDLPGTDQLCRQVLVVPTGAQGGEGAAHIIGGIVQAALRH